MKLMITCKKLFCDDDEDVFVGVQIESDGSVRLCFFSYSGHWSTSHTHLNGVQY